MRWVHVHPSIHPLTHPCSDGHMHGMRCTQGPSTDERVRSIGSLSSSSSGEAGRQARDIGSISLLFLLPLPWLLFSLLTTGWIP